MTPEQWEAVRLSHDQTCAERDRLRSLLDRVRQAIPSDHTIQSDIRAALGLREEIAA